MAELPWKSTIMIRHGGVAINVKSIKLEYKHNTNDSTILGSITAVMKKN